MYERPVLKCRDARSDRQGTGPLMDEGALDAIREVPQLKNRVMRAAMTAAMLAAVVQAFGAGIKW